MKILKKSLVFNGRWLRSFNTWNQASAKRNLRLARAKISEIPALILNNQQNKL